MPPSTATCSRPDVLPGHHPVQGQPGRGDQRPARLDQDLDVLAQVPVRGRDQPGGVLVDARRGVLRHVAHAQAAAEVVDAERAPARPARRPRPRTGPGRGSASRCARAGPAGRSADRRASARSPAGTCVHGHAELGAGAAGGQRRVGGRVDAGADPQQHRGAGRGPAARCGRCRRTRPRRCSRCGRRSAARMSSSDLALPCMTILAGSTPAASASRSSPAPTTSQPRPSSARTWITDADGKALAAKQTRLRGCRLVNAADVLARPGPQRLVLVEHVRRGPELARPARAASTPAMRRSSPSMAADGGSSDRSAMSGALCLVDPSTWLTRAEVIAADCLTRPVRGGGPGQPVRPRTVSQPGRERSGWPAG